MIQPVKCKNRVDESVEVFFKENMVIPAREVLSKAMEINQRLGHENLGFLSETHGFIPAIPPLVSLLSTHKIWDELAEELPDLCRRLEVRQCLEGMPILRADKDSLPDRMLLRASAIISAFAHAYYYVDLEPTSSLPASIEQPWKEIAQRLNRHEAHMSYIDMSTYNWRLLNPEIPDPLRVENLKLLIPIWGNEEERIFLGSTIEIQAQSTPLLMGIIQAQEAVYHDDPKKLELALLEMINCLHHLTYVCLPKVIPNAHSSFYVDPVVWAKTIAPLSVPIRKGAAGPVGAATASLQALDAFLERDRYGSEIAKESIHVRNWFPQHWLNFYIAVKQISVSKYIQQKNNPLLTRLWEDLRHAYAGETGFLGRHRLKAYGYIETAFKSGRSATATFKGSFKDRIWDNIDTQLELARLERYPAHSSQNHYNLAKISEVKDISGNGSVVQVKLCVEGSSVYYRPGDRCAILPENSELLIEKTLAALDATGDESIPLDPVWRVALNYRPLFSGVSHLPLKTLLKLGQIRLIKRPVVKLLFKKTQNPRLQTILENHHEQEWELWDLLEQLRRDGVEPHSLFSLEEDHSFLCQIIPPESFRLYSISSIPNPSKEKGITALDLTVRRLKYETHSEDNFLHKSRQGTASHFLASGLKDPITLRIIPSPHFHLPQDPSCPIVMFAGGTGISPFRSFIQQRGREEQGGQNWLFFSTRTCKDFYYQQEWEQWVAQEKLDLCVAFSQEDIEATFVRDGEGGQFQFIKGDRQKLEVEIQRSAIAAQLCHLLQGKQVGGLGAYFYVCGRTRFANSVFEALQKILEQTYDGTQEQKQQFALLTLERLVAEGRYMQETFTPFTGILEQASGVYDLSEIALHNNEEQGYWFIIEDLVYDITPFQNKHPGGFKILRAYAGMDATPAYQKVRHHQNQEVQAMLAQYRLGIVRPLSNTKGSSRLDHFYHSWKGYLFLLVEIENALVNDFSIQEEAATHDEVHAFVVVSPVKLLMYIKTHQRFVEEFLPQIFGEVFQQVLQTTEKMYREDLSCLLEEIEQVQHSEFAQKTGTVYEQFIVQLKQEREKNSLGHQSVLMRLNQYCVDLEREDVALVRALKERVCAIIKLFEQFGDNVILPEVGSQLRQNARQVATISRQYYEQVAQLSWSVNPMS